MATITDMVGQHFEVLLLLYWSLASFASSLALLPVPGASGFRCWGKERGGGVEAGSVAAATAAAAATRGTLVLSKPLPSNFRRSAVMLSACRGKLMDLKPTTAVLGPLSDWNVPQRWFAHFYALGAAWNAAVAVLLLGSPYYHALPAPQQATCALALALLQLHLTRRLLETVGLLMYPPAARMHGVAYLFGIRWGGRRPWPWW